ncbi:MAG: tryptophan 2,3-dioxygenase [Deltaproteobacteria bacterium]|nr:tryptophan 2,3-dioxygenase [Deltaproteobacteria bacterium]HCH63991.1 tryptophan 2,3-dioxygenase [Deltaproteobacteria bacterium]
MADSVPPPSSDIVPNYWDYLALDRLLCLQNGVDADDRDLVSDELLFIIVHQTYELWFKMILRELREAVSLVGSGPLKEAKVPYVVHHLRRVGQILRLAVEQFHIVETLTPQDFLGFREKLTPASGFQSFQMRELEIILGLQASQRETYGKTDALEHIRELAAKSPAGALAWERLSNAQAAAARGGTIRDVLYEWLYRAPIDGSFPDSAHDETVVAAFLARYEAALKAHHKRQIDRLVSTGLTAAKEVEKRFEKSFLQAKRFLAAEDLTAESFPEGTDLEAERARRRRSRAGLLYIESNRDLPLLAFPRLLIDTIVEVEEQLVLFRTRHARMVERVIGRRVGTGGSSGVDYLDRTTRHRIFGDLWSVRTLLLPKELVPPVADPQRYDFVGFQP